VSKLDQQRIGKTIPENCICGSKKVAIYSEKTPGGTIYLIERAFADAGYYCQWKVLNAADFGVPQIRERLFLVGFKDKNVKFSWPMPIYSNALNCQSDLFMVPCKPWKTMREILWPKGHWHYGALSDKAVLWVKNVVRPHDEPVTWTIDRPSPTVGAHQGAKLALAPYGVPDEQLTRQQWHTRGNRQGNTDPVFVEHKMLTDNELLALQSFPQSWCITGTRMERSFQIGNAVPPKLAQVVGKAIYDALMEK
jgi:DNA (cytosine-5)-methyltransferase 1